MHHTRHHVQASRESDLPAPAGRCIDRDPTPINQNPRSMYIIARRVVCHTVHCPAHTPAGTPELPRDPRSSCMGTLHPTSSSSTRADRCKDVAREASLRAVQNGEETVPSAHPAARSGCWWCAPDSRLEERVKKSPLGTCERERGGSNRGACLPRCN